MSQETPTNENEESVVMKKSDLERIMALLSRLEGQNTIT